MEILTQINRTRKIWLLKLRSKKRSSLETNIFFDSSFAFFIVSVVAIVINIIISLPVIVISYISFANLLQLFIIFIGLDFKRLRLAKILYTLNLYLAVSVVWFFNSGMDGSCILFLYTTYTLSLIFFEKEKLKVTLIAIFVSGGLFSIQYYYPDIFQYYDSREEKLFDVYLTYITLILFNMRILSSIISSYNKERKKVLEQAALLDKQNKIILSQNKNLERDREEFRKLSILDELTGVFNRRHIVTSLQEEMNQFFLLKRKFSLILLDVDFFKKINDTFGHPAGDLVLKEVVNVICSCLRSADQVGRYGGEEFVVILPNADKNNAFKIAERIRIKVASYRFSDPTLPSATISGGIAEIREYDSMDSLLERADQNLYKAKNSGRNKIVC